MSNGRRHTKGEWENSETATISVVLRSHATLLMPIKFSVSSRFLRQSKRKLAEKQNVLSAERGREGWGGERKNQVSWKHKKGMVKRREGEKMRKLINELLLPCFVCACVCAELSARVCF
jgi:hypothetical protein